MTTHCWQVKKQCPQLLALLCLALSLGGCATSTPDSQARSTSELAVPHYVRNLPKSRTGNMAQYTVFGKRYRVMDSAENFSEQGKASWYGKKFHGLKTSSGEIYDMYAMTAAHKHLPLPTYVRVTNMENGRNIVVKVNDRGPFVGTRIIDLSLAAAEALDMVEQGTAQVRVDALSTHLVADNAIESNAEVAQAIDAASRDSATPAPAVLEPELAAVPLLAPALKVLPADNEVAVDSSEDGFVELTDATTGSDDFTAGAANVFIQLGAFSHAPNAEALVADVAEQVGLPAYVEQDATRTMYRVKMGPFKQGALLDTTLSELAGVGIDGYTLRASTR